MIKTDDGFDGTHIHIENYNRANEKCH